MLAKSKVAVLLVSAGVALTACAQESDPTEDTQDSNMQVAQNQDDLILASAKVALPPPGLNPTELPEPDSPGAQHLQTYCSACHALPSPGTHSATDWPVVLRRMWLRTDRIDPSYEIPIPSTAERLVLTRYLTEHALEVTSADLPAGRGRELFSNTCSRCHELPDPQQHTAQDWGAVVIRMAEHSEQMIGEWISPQDREQIMLYLERVSRSGA